MTESQDIYVTGGAPEKGSVLIACAMLEDEVGAVLRSQGGDIRVDWVDRGFHEHPDRLRCELQRRIDDAEARGATSVLLAFGLCGNGAVGLSTVRAVLAMPRFDDCVNMMLCTGPRAKRGYGRAGTMYLTGGWTRDDCGVVGQRERIARQHGARKADRVMRMMYESYTEVSVIDDGCFALAPVMAYGRECAALLGLALRTQRGSIGVLEKLITGRWDEDIIVLPPGVAVKQEDFEYPVRKGREMRTC